MRPQKEPCSCRRSFVAPHMEVVMPIILWLLNVPLSVVLVLFLIGMV